MAHIGKPKWRLSPNRLKWFITLYPPLLFNGIRILSVRHDYQQVRVKIWKNVCNTNFHGSIFGGTVLCAFDPFFGVMLWQILNHRGEKAEVVVMALEAQLKKPAMTSLWLDFKISDAEVQLVTEDLHARGKHVKGYRVDALDKTGQLIATANVVVHIKRKDPPGRLPNLGY